MFHHFFSIAALQRVVKRPRSRFYNAVGVKDVLIACRDVELSKNGDQVDWDGLISHYEAPQETEFQDSDEEADQQENDQDKKHRDGHENLLKKSRDSELGKDEFDNIEGITY